ncbi:hypothetical protein CBS63078_11074 [Aspergillus niger]|nr:hypothetical protein CBS13152_11123 [Aspergillus niger]KAI2869787.1 hypothetical protein CBS11852_11180 [Aspergillus niger]KAI2886032.1 hypothetical protein CBS63078_11074 [Aspergillus niger]KAI3015361.1 hypothetical protein CBS147347_11225 [Aspergillus niger]KAI3033816.1 hypothetical protein CBS76997_11220 [Aspergillus niger]
MLYLLLVPLFFFAYIPKGTDPNNYFISPSSNTGINPVWTLGDEQVIWWKTTLGVFNISFWQESLVQQSAASQGNIYSKIHSTDQVTNFTWVVQLYGFDLNYSNVFFMWINSDDPDGIVSSYFNITKPTATSTTSSSTESDTSTKSLDTTPSPSITPSTDAQPTMSASSDAAQLTTTGQIALGVGIGIGVPVLAALAALVWLKARANKTPAMLSAMPGTMPAWPAMRQPQQLPPKEMQGSDQTDNYPELPGQRAH